MTKCLACEETITKVEKENWDAVEAKDGWIHQGCRDDDLAEPAVQAFYSEGGEDIIGVKGSYCTDIYDYAPELEEYLDSVNWKSSDGWHGCYEGKAPQGWENVIDTWFCGFDGHNIEGLTEKFHEKWSENKERPEFPLIVAFPRTSNLFSTGLEVYVPTDNVEDFTAWLEA